MQAMNITTIETLIKKREKLCESLWDWHEAIGAKIEELNTEQNLVMEAWMCAQGEVTRLAAEAKEIKAKAGI